MNIIDEINKANHEQERIQIENSAVDINQKDVFESLFDFIFEEKIAKDIVANRSEKKVHIIFFVDETCKGVSNKLYKRIKDKKYESEIFPLSSFERDLFNNNHITNDCKLLYPIAYMMFNENFTKIKNFIPFITMNYEGDDWMPYSKYGGEAFDNYYDPDSERLNEPIKDNMTYLKYRDKTLGISLNSSRNRNFNDVLVFNKEYNNNEALIERAKNYILNSFKNSGINVLDCKICKVGDMFYRYHSGFLFSKSYSEREFANIDAKCICIELSW